MAYGSTPMSHQQALNPHGVRPDLSLSGSPCSTKTSVSLLLQMVGSELASVPVWQAKIHSLNLRHIMSMPVLVTLAIHHPAYCRFFQHGHIRLGSFWSHVSSVSHSSFLVLSPSPFLQSLAALYHWSFDVSRAAVWQWDWVLFLWARNITVGWILYGGWHLFLYELPYIRSKVRDYHCQKAP